MWWKKLEKNLNFKHLKYSKFYKVYKNFKKFLFYSKGQFKKQYIKLKKSNSKKKIKTLNLTEFWCVIMLIKKFSQQIKNRLLYY